MRRKKVLLTGGSRGIGKAIHDELVLVDKYTILVPTREEMELSDLYSIDRYMQKNNDIDIVINNAGINIIKHIEDIENEDIHKIMNVNINAPLKIIQKVVPYMKKNKYGKIINLSSIWGIRSKEFRTLYSSTKFGITGQTKALSRELGPYNILINSVSPGFVATDLTNQTVPKDEQEKIKATIPLKRFAKPKEIAKFIKFLVSEENSYITGQSLVIDGGFTA